MDTKQDIGEEIARHARELLLEAEALAGDSDYTTTLTSTELDSIRVEVRALRARLETGGRGPSPLRTWMAEWERGMHRE